MPGIADHELEVVVVIDRCRDIVVVVLPLLARNLAIVCATNVKCVQEFAQDVLFRLFSCNHVRMLRCIVAIHNVLCIQNARAVLVDLCESHRDQIGAALIHGIAYAVKELVEINRTAAIPVKVLEQHTQLRVRQCQSTLAHRFLELGHVQCL